MMKFIVLTTAVMLLVGSSRAPAQESRPEAFAIIEQFSSYINDGRILLAIMLLTGDTDLTERDLHEQVWIGKVQVGRRLWEWRDQGVRLETEVIAVLGEGNVVVAHERVWRNDIPEALAPYHYTSVYLIEGERLASITRLLSAAERSTLMRQHLVDIGTWWDARGVWVHFDTDGTYRYAQTRSGLDADLAERGSADWVATFLEYGTFTIDAGILTMVSGEATNWCPPGSAGTHRFHVIDPDQIEITLIEDACFRRLAPGPLSPLLLTRIDDD